MSLFQTKKKKSGKDREMAKDLSKEPPPTFDTRWTKTIDRIGLNKCKDDLAALTGSVNSIPILKKPSLLDEVAFEYFHSSMTSPSVP